MSTSIILNKMFRENTGRQLCDSGGTPEFDSKGRYIRSTNGYGRGYERIKGYKLSHTPRSILTYHQSKEGGAEINVTISAYWYLLEQLEYSAEYDKMFMRFANLYGNRGSRWLDLMQVFPDWLAKKLKADNLPVNTSNFSVCNTYNGDSLLDYTLQFLSFYIDRKAYVLLQVHTGCDVRSGYTRPRVFTDMNEFTGQVSAQLRCQTNSDEHSWETVDSYVWSGPKNLRDYKLEFVTPEDWPLLQSQITKYNACGVKRKVDLPLYVEVGNKNEQTGHCPICGGTLALNW